LHGDGVWMGMLDIIHKYPWTAAANLAHFYAGAMYIHRQAYEEAIQHLKQFKAKDFLLQARAWALIGDAYAEQQAYKKATTYYLKAANYKPNKNFTPAYLTKAALAHEANATPQSALKCYQRIVEEFPTASQYGEACKHVARLSAVLGD
ncbi:MAG: cytochrome C biosynthesis protein, partial [Bacteroidota bacterium]